MLSIGHVHIRRDELISVSWNGQEVALLFEWPATDFPVLLQLRAELQVSFDHLLGDCGDLAARVIGWRCVRSTSGDDIAVRVCLQLVDGSEPHGGKIA